MTYVTRADHLREVDMLGIFLDSINYEDVHTTICF